MLYVWLMVASVWAGLASPLGLQPAPDWILEDEQVPPPARRITPKSVFVAPTFSECPPGSRHDPIAGRCVRIVKVNQKAQWDFFLSRLNAMYAQPTKQKVQSGPLHLALPLDPITSTSNTRTVPPTTSTPPPTTTTDIPTTTTEMPTTTTTTSVPETTTTYPRTTFTSTQSPITTRPVSTMASSEVSTTQQTTTTTELPPTTTIVSTTFPSTPPTTFYTDSPMDTTFPFSTTDSSTIDFTETSTFPTFPVETTETFTEFSTFSEPVSIPSERQRISVKPKRKCPPSVRRVGDYGGEDDDCETRTLRPHYIRFPTSTYSSRRKAGYVRFPDKTWQASYWWPAQSSWDQRRVPLPSSYQKVQHYPSWHRGRPSWADTPLTV